MTDTPQEIMARGIMEAKGGCIVKDWKAEARDNPHVELAVKQAQAAISALKEAGWEITKRPYTKEEIEVIQCKLERGEAYIDAEGYLQDVEASTPED